MTRLLAPLRPWLWLLLLVPPAPAEPTAPQAICVNVNENLTALLAEQDTDSDKLITVLDKGDRTFNLRATDGTTCQVEGTYPLANLLQQLAIARRTGHESTTIDIDQLYQPPPRRISQMIRRYYWDWLTRSLDPEHLHRAIEDPKIAQAGPQRIYVPHNDPLAQSYYQRLADEHPNLNVEIIELPDRLTPACVHSLDDKPGILSLALRTTADGRIVPLPFVVPGGRFNEMYGWDSYFITLGLLADGHIDLARSMVENSVYEIDHYGKILNANRTYYLTRSQPPFLTSMALAVFPHLPRTPESRDWLAVALRAAIREYETVWTEGDHLTSTGLNRYFDSGTGLPPEVNPPEYADILQPYATCYDLGLAAFAARYRAGLVHVPALDKHFVHDRAMRESGHDTTYRLVGRAANLNTVALNSLLYKYETDIARTIRDEFDDDFAIDSNRRTTSREWLDRARDRRERMLRLMWNEPRGLFFDYDFVEGRQLEYVSATTLYPLWAGLVDDRCAQRLARSALTELEAPGGILSSTEESRGPISPDRPPRQWDYPFGWAPHQMLAWQGLRRYGLGDDAERLAYRWLYMLTLNAARYNGAITEKYDVVNRTFNADVEYGNVGVRFEYVPDGGFGWTNASFQIGLRQLSPPRRQALDRMIPPEQLFTTQRTRLPQAKVKPQRSPLSTLR